MSDAGKLKVIMEEMILKLVKDFEAGTGLMIEELRMNERFEPTSPILITSRCVLRNPK